MLHGLGVIGGPGIHHEPLSTRLGKFLVVPMWWGILVHDIQYGCVRGRFSTAERDESPITFWINIAVYFRLLPVGIVLLLMGRTW